MARSAFDGLSGSTQSTVRVNSVAQLEYVLKHHAYASDTVIIRVLHPSGDEIVTHGRIVKILRPSGEAVRVGSAHYSEGEVVLVVSY